MELRIAAAISKISGDFQEALFAGFDARSGQAAADSTLAATASGRTAHRNIFRPSRGERWTEFTRKGAPNRGSRADATISGLDDRLTIVLSRAENTLPSV